MKYQVLARKWRPQNFASLVGQDHAVRALVHALDQNRLHQAYLFTGTRGVGKTTIARIIAKCLNCEQGVSSTPCGSCSSCEEISAGRFVDLLEIDAASRTKVEDTRELLDNVQYSPTKGRYKVYLIDEVHMLSGHSFNALLKTLEEPPPHVIFLLATTDPQKLPATVLSRCLQFHLKNLPPEKITAYLQQVLQAEKIEHEEAALALLARAADGSMRDGLSLLDQGIAYGNGRITTADMQAMLGSIEQTYFLDLVSALAANNAASVLAIIQQLAEQAVDFSQALEEILSLLHQLAITQALPEADFTNHNYGTHLPDLARQFTGEEIQLFYQIGLIGRRDLPYAPTPKIGFEMVLLRMLAFKPDNSAHTASLATSGEKNRPAATIDSNIAAPPSSIKPRNTIEQNQDWAQILPQLNLTGTSRALATHCTATIASNAITVWLDPEHAALLTDKQKQRIKAALMEYFQRPMQVLIQIGKQTSETPANVAQRQQAEQHQQATSAIQQNQNVQAIIDTFNATIIPDSITCIDS